MTEYEEGAFAVLAIIKRVQEKHEAPLRKVEIGPGYVALNALTHWGQAISADVESELLRHLMERKKPVPAKAP